MLSLRGAKTSFNLLEPMKADLHPEYHPVIFQDLTTGTGKAQFVDTEGRIDKFQKRFGGRKERRKKPTLG